MSDRTLKERSKRWSLTKSLSAMSTKEKMDTLMIHIANDNRLAVEAIRDQPDVDVNRCDDMGRHPLHVAAERDHSAVVALLRAHGAERSARNA